MGTACSQMCYGLGMSIPGLIRNPGIIITNPGISRDPGIELILADLAQKGCYSKQN